MIEVRHLRYFVALAEELNFRRAAVRIHIDQSPLSRAIRNLDEVPGVPLFVRLPRRFQFMPAGLKLLIADWERSGQGAAELSATHHLQVPGDGRQRPVAAPDQRDRVCTEATLCLLRSRRPRLT